MFAGPVARAHAESLSSPGIGWALARALRLTIAVGVIALVLATTISGEGAERLATVAYLSAIFAAIVLLVQRLLPAAPDESGPAWTPTFPSFLTFFMAVALFLGAAAALAAAPGGEALLVAVCAVLVALAVLSKNGTLASVNDRFAQGGMLAQGTRYAVAVAVCALALTALLPADAAGVVASFAYALAIAATMLLAISLFSATPPGAALLARYGRFVGTLDRLTVRCVFERIARYAAIAAAIVMIPAGVLLAPYSEPFAVIAYLAAVAAAFGVAMECRKLRG